MISRALMAAAWVGLMAIVALAARADEAETERPAPPQRLYDLRYKFEAGETVRTEVVHRATVETTIQGTAQTAETRSRSIKAWKITNVSPSGHVRFVHSVESIDMWQHTKGRQEVRYNSETDKKVPPGYEEAAKAVGVPLTIVTIDRRGKVLKREEMHRQAVGGTNQITFPLPTKAVAIGYKWSAPQDMEVLLKGGATKMISARQQFTLAKVEDGIATIDVETQVLTPVHDPAIEAQLVQRMTSGSVRFDIGRGRIIDQQMDLDKRVVGFSGPSSSMHYMTRFTEELLRDEATARQEPPSDPRPSARRTKLAPARR